MVFSRIAVKRLCGNDIMFDEELPGKGFTNKIWNAFKLIKGWEVSDNTATRIFKGSYRMV
jgi:hypothetical protein